MLDVDAAARELVAEALKTLDGGRAWCQGHAREDETGNVARAWCRPEHVTARCVSSALQDEALWLTRLRGEPFRNQVFNRAYDLVLEATPSRFCTIPDWNDSEATSWPEVERVLSGVAA